RLPKGSCTSTTTSAGWAVPATALTGWPAKASWLSAAGRTVNEAEVADRLPAAAVSVNAPAFCRTRPLKVARPLASERAEALPALKGTGPAGPLAVRVTCTPVVTGLPKGSLTRTWEVARAWPAVVGPGVLRKASWRGAAATTAKEAEVCGAAPLAWAVTV